MQTLEYSKRIETTLDPIHKNKILVSMLIFALISLASDNLDFLNDYLIQFLLKRNKNNGYSSSKKPQYPNLNRIVVSKNPS
jgi:hypothetical protein